MESDAVRRYAGRAANMLVHTGNFPVVKVILVVIWFFALWWGEKSAYESKTSDCHWEKWEQWPTDATPHHLVLLTDPQLVDPHTYPGRPWPLDRLTVAHTDQYMRRSYQALQDALDPDSIVFLGDLFDGGREWWTGRDPQPEDKTWRKWGQSFWLKEYDRWGRIFLQKNGQTARSSGHPRGDRKIIASLPGNHDLGFAKGVRKDVRDRFGMYFGDGNRVDVIGNHSFVSVDTVSLEAKTETQSQQGPYQAAMREIWEPADNFLKDVKKTKAQAVERYLNGKHALPENPRFEHHVYDISSPESLSSKTNAGSGVSANIPTVLLTHVPLYRAKGTPCGPLREKHPPSKDWSKEQGEVVDERNAIALASGYQYQNVLHPEISKELVEKVGDVVHVFSGDDHDYCEVVHRGYTSNGGGIREITVKSMSWAMGIRKPGFLLVSLWNPVDVQGRPLSTHEKVDGATIQTKLCLLPDALGTLIGYGQLFAFTAIVLAILTFNTSKSHGQDSGRAPILPVNNSSQQESRGLLGNSASSSIADGGFTGLAARPRTRNSSINGGYAIPLDDLNSDPLYSSSKGKPNAYAPSFFGGWSGKKTRWQVMRNEFVAGLLQVGIAGTLWYIVLARRF